MCVDLRVCAHGMIWTMGIPTVVSTFVSLQAAAERIQACFQGRMVREQAGAFELHKLHMVRQWFGLLVTVLRLVVNGLSSPNRGIPNIYT